MPVYTIVIQTEDQDVVQAVLAQCEDETAAPRVFESDNRPNICIHRPSGNHREITAP